MTARRSRPVRSLSALILSLAATSVARPQAVALAPPPKHPLTVADALAVRIVSDPQISPDGAAVLYAVSTPDTAGNARTVGTVLASTAAGAAASRAFPDDTSHASEARWSPDGRRIAYVAGGRLWVADASGGGRHVVARLTGGAAGPVWAPTGDAIAFTSAVTPTCDTDACNADRAQARARRGVRVHAADQLMYRHWNEWDDSTRRHLFAVSPDGGLPRDLTAGARYDVPPGPFGGSEGYAFSPDGREVAYAAKDQGRADAWSTDVNIYVVPAAGGPATVITEANAGADDRPVYSPDGRFFAYRSQARVGFESDRERLMLFDRAARRSIELLPTWDRSVESYQFAPDGKSLLVECIEAAHTKLFRVSLADRPDGKVVAEGAPQAIVSERNNADVTIDRAGRTIAWLRDAIDRPPEVYAAALSAGGLSSVRAVSHVNDALLANVRLYPAEEFWFPSVRGDSVQGLVVRPPQWAPGARYPVVLAIHGGPQSAWLDSWQPRWNAQLLASPGYGVVLVNPRGSPGYGQRFVDAVSRDWGGAPTLDLMNGLDAALQRFGWLDGTRAAAVGASYGGYMVNWIAGHEERFRALVSHAGVYDLEAFAGATDEAFFAEWEFGGQYWDPIAMATQYRTWSPHLSARRFRTPMLVTHGELDFRVPYTESLSLFAALQRQGVPSRLIIFPDEGHWVIKPQDQLVWWTEVLGWLARWLTPPGGS